jgi:phosphate:Na+ symporter
MLHVIAGFLGGMGLFFMGLTFTGNGVRSMAGRGLRDLLLTWTKNRLSGVTAGIMAGLAFQSTSAISLLLASLVGAGAISVSRALPVMAGSNIGSSFLVLMAVIDIGSWPVAARGSGLAIAFERPARLQHAATILFGVGLILFGLGIVRTSCAPLAEADWFRQIVATQGLPLPVYLLIGTVACLALQTSAGVSILSITLAASGVMDGDDALAVIFGSLFGSSLLSRFYAIRFKGLRKRLVMGQVLFNVVGLCLFLPRFSWSTTWACRCF